MVYLFGCFQAKSCIQPFLVIEEEVFTFFFIKEKYLFMYVSQERSAGLNLFVIYWSWKSTFCMCAGQYYLTFLMTNLRIQNQKSHENMELIIFSETTIPSVIKSKIKDAFIFLCVCLEVDRAGKHLDIIGIIRQQDHRQASWISRHLLSSVKLLMRQKNTFCKALE